MPQIERAPGGFKVDGLEFIRGKCGCSGMGGDCCYTYSKVKKEGNTLIYEGKATAPSTSDNYVWGYLFPAVIPRPWRLSRSEAGRWKKNLRNPWKNNSPIN
ncbi:MAG: hypothetical protein P8X49_11935 [Syntrophobacterales bacterium]